MPGVSGADAELVVVSVNPAGRRIKSRAVVVPCMKVEVLVVSISVNRQIESMMPRTLESIDLIVLGPESYR